MSTIAVNTNNFDQEALQSNTLEIIDFSAAWCGPCKMMAPLFEEASNEHQNIRFITIDIDESPQLAERYNVRAVPTLVFIKNAQVVMTHPGVVSKQQLAELITKNLLS